jgi:hypothetical protein
MTTFYISHSQALGLELKINKSEYNYKWKYLADLFFSWRLDHSLYKINNPLEYYISPSQYEWITKNIDKVDNNFKSYKLTVIPETTTINIVSPIGETIQETIESIENIWLIKKKLSERLGNWFYFIRLFLEGNEDELKDSDRLFEKKIKDNSNIFILLSNKAEIKITKKQCKTIANIISMSDFHSIRWNTVKDNLNLWARYIYNDKNNVKYELPITKYEFEWIYERLVNKNENKNELDTCENNYSLIMNADD